MLKRLNIFVLIFFLCLSASIAYAKNPTADVLTFNPVSDGGKYLTLHQSKTLHQWGFNVGIISDYAYKPLEIVNQAGIRNRGVVDALIMSHLVGAIGWTDWWSTGFDASMAWYEVFYDPVVKSPTKDIVKFKLADPRIETKFRILDIDRYSVGLAVVPFVYLPYGSEGYFLGNGMWNYGGNLVVDFDIKNRVFLTLNAGYRYYKTVHYNTQDPDAWISPTIPIGLGINVRINDEWAMLAEAWAEPQIKAFFKNEVRNPAEFLVATKFTPKGSIDGLGFTLGGGRAITRGIGNPVFRVFLGINYSPPRVVVPPPPAEVDVLVEEKIVITQKIHFEFAKATIRPVSYPILDDVVMLLQKNPQIMKVKVEGHTDWVGSDKFNQILSEKRARAVRDYLISKGIEPERLVAVGYGESRPIADNETAIGRARNRRTEFTVLEVSNYLPGDGTPVESIQTGSVIDSGAYPGSYPSAPVLEDENSGGVTPPLSQPVPQAPGDTVPVGAVPLK